MILGTVINVGAIVVGSLIGMTLHKGIPARVLAIIFQSIGLFTLFLGMSLAFETDGNYFLISLALIFGGVLGASLNLEERSEQLSHLLKEKLKSKNPKFTEGLITSSMLFSIGSMAIIGPMNEALKGDLNLILTKSMMDGITSVALAAAFGRSILFSVIPVFLLQAGVGLGAKSIEPYLSEGLINELTAVGGILIIGIGINLLELQKIKLINLLPSMLVIILLYWLKGFI